jgi:ATP-dependent DNA helicase PIF1
MAEGKAQLEMMGLLGKKKRDKEAALSPTQTMFMEEIMRGKNCFITGPAGVGKTFLISEIIKTLKSLKKKVGIAATTGVAAASIKGTTVHSWFGVGFADKPVEEYIAKRKEELKKQGFGYERAATRIVKTDVLIIDEISMMGCDFFGKIDDICRAIRPNGQDSPFGGLQLIVVGDFFQLPPIPDRHPKCWNCGGSALDKNGGVLGQLQCTKGRFGGDGVPAKCKISWSGQVRFAFNDDPFGRNRWDECGFVFCELTDVFRQKDKAFVELLHRIRLNKTTPEDVQLLEGLKKPLDCSDGILPTKIYPHNETVNEENDRNYALLDGKEHMYKAIDKSKNPESYLLKQLQKSSPALDVVRLKVGTQVMLVANEDVDKGFCNGARGVVTDFIDVTDAEQRAKYKYEGTEVSISKILPVVTYAIHGRTKVKVVNPYSWSREKGREIVSRHQIPLRPAWAITIHKTQGMSLSRVEMSLAEAFAEGQVYVGLSRATGMDVIHLATFDPAKIKTNQKVVDFYDACRRSRTKKRDFTDDDAAAGPAKSPKLDD